MGQREFTISCRIRGYVEWDNEQYKDFNEFWESEGVEDGELDDLYMEDGCLFGVYRFTVTAATEKGALRAAPKKFAELWEHGIDCGDLLDTDLAGDYYGPGEAFVVTL